MFTVRVRPLTADDDDGPIGWASYAAPNALHPIDFGVCHIDDLDGIALAGYRRFRMVMPADEGLAMVWHG